MECYSLSNVGVCMLASVFVCVCTSVCVCINETKDMNSTKTRPLLTSVAIPAKLNNLVVVEAIPFASHVGLQPAKRHREPGPLGE